MIDPPKTLDEAKAHRYRVWAGNPNGTAYNPRDCAYEVWDNHLSAQCSNKAKLE